MKKIFFILILLFMSPYPLGFGDLEDSGVKESGKEIQILNLLNSLYLTKEQMEFVLVRAKELEGLKEGTGDKQCAKDVLENIKEDLKKDNYVTDANIEEFSKIKKEKEVMKKMYTEKASLYAQEVKDKLTPIQQQIIEDYKPCIIPPKGPARIGQADNENRFIKHIERVREFPDETYNQQKEEIAKRAIERWINSPIGQTLTEEEEMDIKNKLLAFNDKIKNMEDVEYEINKENLAKEFKDIFPRREIKLDQLTKIQRFLLSSDAIKILEEKLLE